MKKRGSNVWGLYDLLKMLTLALHSVVKLPVAVQVKLIHSPGKVVVLVLGM